MAILSSSEAKSAWADERAIKQFSLGAIEIFERLDFKALLECPARLYSRLEHGRPSLDPRV